MKVILVISYAISDNSPSHIIYIYIYIYIFIFAFVCNYIYIWASQVALMVKNLSTNAGDIRCGFDPLGQEDHLEKEMAIYSSILAWRCPWTEEPGRLQFMQSHKVRHN